jgi:2-oxoglutarate dehydrogenase E2 component (dihydrolipoamide succinyltransferase)
MAIELKVPAAGESITEVTVVEWLKGEGAYAEKDEPVALIETDKANVEVMAPEAGVVSRVMKKAGEMARVGEVIAMFEPGAAKTEKPAEKTPAPAQPAQAQPAPAQPAPAQPPPKPSGNIIHTQPPQPATPPQQTPVPQPPQQAAAPQPVKTEEIVEPGAVPVPELAESDEHLSPSKRRAAREGNGAPPQSAPATPAKQPVPKASKPAEPIKLREGEKETPMTPMRKRVAERLLDAQQNAALLTTFNEVEMSAVIELRKQFGEQFKEKHGVKLGFMSFFVRATVDALRTFPAINSEIRGESIIERNFFDVGVAVGGGKGLVVPIIRNAEKKSFAELEKTIADYGERAKTGRLKVDELQGGTFTISNGGIYGSMMSTPIVNPPQSGILGMHAIQERPVARKGVVVIAPMMYLALTYDHRIVDGREAVSFLVRIKEGIENPARLLLEV